jgi:hypothetical protein
MSIVRARPTVQTTNSETCWKFLIVDENTQYVFPLKIIFLAMHLHFQSYPHPICINKFLR